MNSSKLEKLIVETCTSTPALVEYQVRIRSFSNISNNLPGIIQRHSGANTESSVAVHEECEWTIEPPPHRVMKIQVSMADIRDGESNI